MGRPHWPAFSPTSPPARALLRVFSMFAWRPPVLMVSTRLTDTARRILVGPPLRQAGSAQISARYCDLLIVPKYFGSTYYPRRRLKQHPSNQGEDNRCGSYSIGACSARVFPRGLLFPGIYAVFSSGAYTVLHGIALAVVSEWYQWRPRIRLTLSPISSSSESKSANFPLCH